MIKFKLFNNFNAKKKIALIALLIFAFLLILGKNYISEVANVPSIRIHLINIAKVAIPLKNHILMRNVDDKIALLESSGSCVFCDLTQGNFEGSDLKGVDLRRAILIGANLSNTNLIGASLSNTNLSGADLSGANLSNTNLIGANLSNTNLIGADLSGVDISAAKSSSILAINTNLTGANLSGVDLSNEDLTEVNLSRVDLRNTNLTGTILSYANLTGANLDGVDLSNTDLTGADLSRVDLRNTNLTGTILSYANLTGANLDGVDLSNKDLTGVHLSGVDLRNKVLTGTNLSGVDLSNIDLTGTILKDATKIEISVKNPSNLNWPALNEIQNLNVTRYDLSGDVQYLSTKEGFLFESRNNESKLVLDLNKESQFSFDSDDVERGILGIASKNNLVYVSYSSLDIDGSYSLVVDEYSMNFSKVRNIIKIGGYHHRGFAGSLSFDSLGKLYLSVGDGGEPRLTPISDSINPQNLNTLKGKILRLDVSKSKLEPEIVAYGIRNPWGVTIDSKDRMFIVQCGYESVEAVYLLNDLYSDIPPNLGWPTFEGSRRMRKDPLMFKDVLAPIFETNKRPGCLTGALYLSDIELFLFADFYGTIRLLKQQENGDWYLLLEYKLGDSIWGFGLDKKTKKIFIAPNNLELEILVDQVKLNQK
jgi:uncharacterized protein YjbI with pentapeptide repeats